MDSIKKQDISFIDWGGKVVGAVGILGMAAYIAGYFKYYFFYSALNCSWVLGLHSVQDVIVNGVVDVALCSLSAVPLFFGFKTSTAIDNDGRRIVGFMLIGIMVSVAAGVLLLDYNLGVYAADLLTYGACYLIYGVSIANIARYSTEQGSYQYLLAAFLGFVFSTCFSSCLVNQYKTFASVDEKGGFAYQVIAEDGTSSVLVGTVSGKYLLHLCDDYDRYKLIAPSRSWIVEPRGSEQCRATQKITK